MQVFLLNLTYLIGPLLFIGNLVYFEIKPQFYLCEYADGAINKCSLEQICAKEP